ncbi:hypothetical protein [Frankia sp. R82]|uniref:hypothetical protein n=1 Tax=Frankia sp. R82 TaxID=2950553 RepID=UPI0020447293|nr:hypothetical protein [Frankia sp. R82]MCM3884251.1 hypothetical protein [Frankia sp. R82]
MTARDGTARQAAGPPSGRVLVDPTRLRGLAGAVGAAAEVLRTGARTLARVVSLVAGLAGLAGFADQLLRLGAAFDSQAAALTRRGRAAEQADVGLPRALPAARPLQVAPALARLAGPTLGSEITYSSSPPGELGVPVRSSVPGDGTDTAGSTTVGERPTSGPHTAAWATGRDAAAALTSDGATTALLAAGLAGALGAGSAAADPRGRSRGAGVAGDARFDARAGRRLGSADASGAGTPPDAGGSLRDGPGDSGGGHRGGGHRGGEHGGDGTGAASARREALQLLGTHENDPGFVAGFYDTLGPAGLASLLTQLSGRSTGPLGNRPPAEAGVNRAQAHTLLGRTFAAYSRQRGLDDTWLGRLNTSGRTDRVDAVLLTPLLGAGRFDTALLDRLARLAFGPEPAAGAASSGGSGIRQLAGAGRQRGAASPSDYQVALLDAIRIEPTLVARVAARHVEMVVGAALVGTLKLPVRVALPAATLDAWLRIIAAAGEPAVRAADPRGSADFAGRLARAVAATDQPMLPPRLRAAFVPVLHTYHQEIYATVTAVAPGRIGGADPADGLSGVPVTAWRALLRECLRGGALAGLLARDAAGYGVDLEARQAARTRGWNQPAGGYPSSPRALGYLQAVRAQTFFAQVLVDAADDVIREHTASGGAYRRRQGAILDLLSTVATSIDPSDPRGTMTKMGVGLTVDAIEILIRQRYRDTSTTGSRRVLADLREAAHDLPDWAESYEASARLLWARRASDPLRPVAVTDGSGQRRLYTGDPHKDGFITGPRTDFLDATGVPLAAAAMTPAQRGAYRAWLESPAMVANNDRLPLLSGLATMGDTRLPPDRALRPDG